MESTVTLSGVKPYFQSDTGNNILYHGDCMELLPLLNGKVDVVFADPPYFLSNGGFSVQSGKIVTGLTSKTLILWSEMRLSR